MHLFKKWHNNIINTPTANKGIIYFNLNGFSFSSSVSDSDLSYGCPETYIKLEGITEI